VARAAAGRARRRCPCWPRPPRAAPVVRPRILPLGRAGGRARPGERPPQPAVALGGSAPLPLPRRLVVAGADPRPRTQVLLVGELPHVAADLRHHVLDRPPVHPRDRVEALELLVTHERAQRLLDAAAEAVDL